MLRFIHAADFHLDSAFAALTPRQAAARRRESRELPVRLANYVNQNNIDLVLLAGDLFDSAASYRDTAEELSAALGQMEAQVYIAPGNHDWYGPGSPYLTVKWPENVHIFTQPRLETMEWPEKIWCSTVRPLPTVSKPTASSLASPPPPTGSSISACSTGRSTPRRPGTIPSARRRSPPAALPIWRWDTSTSGRSL